MMSRLESLIKESAMANQRKNTSQAPLAAPRQLLLLFTVVNRDKAEFYADVIQHYEANMQLTLTASGTASTKMLGLLGLASTEKSVIISVIRRDTEKEVLEALGEKFKTVRGGKGIAYTVPMTSTIGVAIYQFLSNTTSDGGLI